MKNWSGLQGKKITKGEWKKLRAEFSIPLILLSLGKEGSRAYCGEEYAEVPAFYREDTIETTGAGRNFKVYFGIKVCYNVPV